MQKLIFFLHATEFYLFTIKQRRKITKFTERNYRFLFFFFYFRAEPTKRENYYWKTHNRFY